jgi:hypothetical protein
VASGKWGAGRINKNNLLSPEQCLRIDQKRDTIIDCSI